MRIIQIIAALLLLFGVAFALYTPTRMKIMGSYDTSLEGRTRGQHINAVKSAQALDGVVIEPGQQFSFNKTVGSWSPDRGYVRAPVSYDGELLVDWGGGVCQTSSTLYNAALIAGLEVVERNRHAWAPQYIPPGRDAAVAQANIDLRLRNPYKWPVRIRTRIVGKSILGFDILGREAGPHARVTEQLQAGVQPVEIVQPDTQLAPGQRRVLTRGRPGVRVALYRTHITGPRAGQREMISQDAYPAMNRVVLVGVSR